MKMLNRSFKLLAVLVILLFLLTACGGKDNSKRDRLVIAQGADAPTLDLHAINDQPSERIKRQIYNNLVKFNEDMELEADLAESWEQVDDLTWIFKLRKGVKFHNGEELTADDVKFTFERHAATPTVSHYLEAIEEVNVVDANTVELKTKEPFAPILAHLGHTCSGILNQKAVEEYGEDYGQNPIGTGPFKFVSWDIGDQIVLERFDDFFGDKAKTKEIVFRNIPEGSNRLVGLETGEIDIAYNIDPVDRHRVEENEDLRYTEDETFAIQYLGFNNMKEPCSDKRFRQAISYGINTDEILDAVLENSAVRAYGPLQEKVFGANPDIKGYEYDPEKAKQILTDAGYTDNITLELWSNENPLRLRIAETIQGQLKDIGIDVKVEVLEWGTYLERTGAGEHDMFLLGSSVSTGDADNGLSSLYHSKQKGSAGNRSFCNNKELDKYLDLGRKEMDQEKRKEYYYKAQDIIVDEAVNAFLYFDKYNAGLQKNIKGFRIHPAGYNFLDKVEIVE